VKARVASRLRSAMALSAGLCAYLIACSSEPGPGDGAAGNGTGGAVSSGGSGITGGNATGGVVSTGGASGGTPAVTGGVAATGGEPSTGGVQASGGTATGGTSGGNSSSGGAIGTSGGAASGGSSQSGGSSTGGTNPTGGTSGSGGTLATGGTVTTGGAAGAPIGGQGGLNSSGGSGGGNTKATIVVRGAGTATAGDQAMIERIKARGFTTVTVVSDAAVTAQSVMGSALVVISSSAESGPLQAKLKDIPIPVLCVEDAEFRLMGMASSGDHDAGVSQMVVSTPASPLLGTLSGTVTISSKAGELGWGTPAAAALKAAAMPGDPSHVVVFGYEKGAQMATMVAPARRAGFAIREAMAASLTADGVKAFDAILDWVVR
jgi:hypothetical protein